MLVGALAELPGNEEKLQRELEKASVDAAVTFKKKMFGGIRATAVKYNAAFSDTDTLGKIEKKLSGWELAPGVKKEALKTFSIIFKAEGAVHGKSPREVHLHELGKPETLLEIVSFFILLGRQDLYCLGLPLGRGEINTAHGEIPVPSPVVSKILEGVPVRFTSEKQELVTPTAAALLKSRALFERPEMIIKKTAFGAGSRNYLRCYHGKLERKSSSVIELRVNIDDMTGEDVSCLVKKLRSESLDVFITPVLMKKSRPGSEITVLCRIKKFERVRDILYKNSTTAGFRYNSVSRDELEREIKEFESSYGKCRIKKTIMPAGEYSVKPEMDDLIRLSRESALSAGDLRRKITEEYENE